jgi:hypothetical protein
MNEIMKEDGKTKRMHTRRKEEKRRMKETPWTRFLLKKLILALYSKISASLMEPVGS